MNVAFSSIIGHEAVKKRLSVQLERNAVPHALLFYGPRHLGKGKVAESFVSAFLGVRNAVSHPNFRLVGRTCDPKSLKLTKHIGIGAIRELRKHMQMTGFLGGRKVVIVDEAELMTEEATNGLLKTLEEPPEGSVIILVVHDISRILPTVRSRSALFPFTRVSDVAIEEALRKHGIPETEIRHFSRFSAGRPGIAFALKNDPDMLHWYMEQESRWYALRQDPLHRRFSSLEAIVPARADREETVRVISDMVSLWEILLRVELRRGSLDARRLLENLANLRAGLDTNVRPMILLERFAMAMEPIS